MKYDALLNTGDPEWKEKARALMLDKKTFVAEQWDIAFDREDTVALIKEFSYKYSLDPKTGQAFFRPKDSL